MSAVPKPSLWRRIGNSWRARRRKSAAIDLLADGFVITRAGRSQQICWDDVAQIDCGTRDTISIDLFFAVFRTARGAFAIDEYDDGFHPLENAVFGRWPQIRERWIALQCGPLHQPQSETLWRR
ncbi:MAG: hypothetical protein ACREHF_09610 [Rhizomicrobium sp.]